jgi:hypothetical protein
MILFNSDVIWSEYIISSSFSLLEGFMIIIVYFPPFNITLALTTYSYYLLQG